MGWHTMGRGALSGRSISLRMRIGARDVDLACFKRLPERIENGPLELRQLVEEQHSAVRQRDLAGARRGVPS